MSDIYLDDQSVGSTVKLYAYTGNECVEFLSVCLFEKEKGKVYVSSYWRVAPSLKIYFVNLNVWILRINRKFFSWFYEFVYF